MLNELFKRVRLNAMRTMGGLAMIVHLEKFLTSLGSVATIGFGIWHFYVPRIWHWYTYIDEKATELLVAVRAVNAFFSLSLILFGVLNLLMVYGNKSNRYSILVTLGVTSFLWFFRVIFQLVFPQGTMSRVLQYGMLLTFILIFLCFAVSLVIILFNRQYVP